jgi:hypothetical protein
VAHASFNELQKISSTTELLVRDPRIAFQLQYEVGCQLDKPLVGFALHRIRLTGGVHAVNTQHVFRLYETTESGFSTCCTSPPTFSSTGLTSAQSQVSTTGTQF